MYSYSGKCVVYRFVYRDRGPIRGTVHYIRRANEMMCIGYIDCTRGRRVRRIVVAVRYQAAAAENGRITVERKTSAGKVRRRRTCATYLHGRPFSTPLSTKTAKSYGFDSTSTRSSKSFRENNDRTCSNILL